MKNIKDDFRNRDSNINVLGNVSDSVNYAVSDPVKYAAVTNTRAITKNRKPLDQHSRLQKTVDLKVQKELLNQRY